MNKYNDKKYHMVYYKKMFVLRYFDSDDMANYWLYFS